MEDFVRASSERGKKETYVEGGRSCETQQEVPYLPGWTEEVFVVARVMRGVVPTYKINEWDGTPLKGPFYEEDLQKVRVNDLFRVEKIVKRKGDKVLVRWKGWPDKYDSWIEKRALVST